ncbi:MAG TPA: glycosyltransferase family 39 protein [Lacunisphaera sp.]
MAAPDSARPAPRRLEASWPEFGFILLVVLGGFLFLGDAPYWGRSAYIGTAQFGDAEFWWNGALHLAEGIVADNPNLVFRMGYAAFAGCFVAVLGPDYHLFHQILVTLFLVTAGAVYLSLRGVIGRIAAGAAIIFLVFNPYTAEWLAISTSDSLGLMLNLAAILALVAGVRDGLRLRWIALFGIFLACASLTRPLMTPFILPAMLAVVVTGWPAWRRTARALAVLLGAFFLPTLLWMGVMGVTTGNFALTGASQDSSAFYAASDPQIQTWRADMYGPVNESAKKRFHTATPTPRQLNAEFWTLIRENYVKHWRYHAARLWSNVSEYSAVTPNQSTRRTPATEQWYVRFKWIFTLALIVTVFREQRQWTAIGLLILGSYWAMEPFVTPGLVLAGALAGLCGLLARRPGTFVWAAYWWTGVAALYLVGGVMGPPLGSDHGLTALGHRLGFQFLFANDLLVIGLLGSIALGRTPAGSLHEDFARVFQPSAQAGKMLRAGATLFFAVLLGVLVGGAAIVGWRVYARSHTAPVPYPDAVSLTHTGPAARETLIDNFDLLRSALGAQDGRSILIKGQSGGFIWNMPGQKRSMLLVYQQDNIRPVSLSPRGLYLEVASPLPEREWMNRQGLWALRSYPDLAPVSSLPYYFQMPAIRAFIPLSADGKSYDSDRAVVFPIAKTATQLVKSRELVFSGPQPEWSIDSGALQFPRCFSLRATATEPRITWELDVTQARGHRSCRFSLQYETVQGSGPVHARLETKEGVLLWAGDLDPAAEALLFEPELPAATTGLRFTAPGVPAGDALWFYELVLEADDFTR